MLILHQTDPRGHYKALNVHVPYQVSDLMFCSFFFFQKRIYPYTPGLNA